ncbi:hypothetical protein PTKIN_Ptkin12aG0213700 [Pterospermum kingtungense]
MQSQRGSKPNPIPKGRREIKKRRDRYYRLKQEINAIIDDLLRELEETEELQESDIQQLNDQLKDLDVNQPMLESSKSKGVMEGSSIGEGTSVVLPPVVNVEGFSVLEENSIMIQELLNRYPNIASGLQLQHQSSQSLVMNTVARVYKMAREEKHTLEEIKHMEMCIRDLEFVGVDVSWLKAMVVECREGVEEKEEEDGEDEGQEDGGADEEEGGKEKQLGWSCQTKTISY